MSKPILLTLGGRNRLQLLFKRTFSANVWSRHEGGMMTLLQKLRRAAVRTLATTVAVVGAVEVTTHLPSQGRSSEFYHRVSDQVCLPILRRALDPETAHNVGLQLAKRGLAPTFRPSAVEQNINVSSRPFSKYPLVTFENCVGLAAGFDKNGEAIQPLLNMGFGFVEIGSVTPEPQPGNPRPRMFRLVPERAIINRYGFNSEGCDAVERHLQTFRNLPVTTPAAPAQDTSSQPLHKKTVHLLLEQMGNAGKTILSLVMKPPVKQKGVLGVNLGKNKDGDEIHDYRRGIQLLGPYADYLVINVSSPNTPGLRDLQQAHVLRVLLKACIAERNALDKPVPLLVKLAPDLNDNELAEIAQAVMECGVDGIVVCNTTMSRPSHLAKTEMGGLSGAPLRDISTECIRKLYSLTDGNVPIIGVGGIANGHDAYEKLKAGASLIQIYSMMVYEGPGVVSRIRKELAQLMVENGQTRLEVVVGMDHDDLYWKKREERLLSSRSEEELLIAD